MRLYPKPKMDPRSTVAPGSRYVRDEPPSGRLFKKQRETTKEEAVAQIADDLEEMVTLAEEHEATSPIGKAARAAIHLLGWELYLLGQSVEEMSKMCEAMATLRGGRHSRIETIDKCWAGVGSEETGVWRA